MKSTEIEDIFDQGGILEKKLDTYEVRQGQIEMSKVVATAFEKNQIAIIEAGTGIGKSYAYLVPALYNAIFNSEEKTVIATATINLQAQLYKKDVPQLFSILGKECSVALAVGRGNYVCIRRAREKLSSDAVLAMDPSSRYGEFATWLANTENGLLTEYTSYLPYQFSEINSDGELCPNFKCPHRKECFYFKNKEKCLESRIIITNHHLLFTDAKSRVDNEIPFSEEAVLPPYNRLIIDEAHNIEATATEFFSSSYSGYSVMRRITKIMVAEKGKTRNLIEEIGAYSTQGVSIDKAVENLYKLKNSVESLTTFLLDTFQKTNFEPLFIQNHHQRRLSKFVDCAKEVVESANNLDLSVSELLKYVQVPDTEKNKERELKTNVSRIVNETLVLDEFCNFSEWTDDIHWFDAERRRGKVIDMSVIISPLEVATSLISNLYKNLDTVVFTSATLNLEDDFKYWGSRVGLPFPSENTFVKESFLSPFDYKNRLLLLTPADAPSSPYMANVTNEKEHKEKEAELNNYNMYMAETIFKSVRSSDGGALVLFTSRKTMNDVKDIVVDMFDEEGLTLLTQGDMSKDILLNQFKNDQNSTLFALNSFWEGIDAPGNTLRLVIIVKLPFQVPSQPIIKARSLDIEKQNKSAFFSLSLPSATMKLKQGFGRLMRSTADYGVVLILDSRITTKNYGKYMLRSLPPCYHPETLSDGVSDKIENFLYSDKEE
jgi:ATP-dependent DNA helicase DinG